jgi:hypothetical protein
VRPPHRQRKHGQLDQQHHRPRGRSSPSAPKALCRHTTPSARASATSLRGEAVHRRRRANSGDTDIDADHRPAKPHAHPSRRQNAVPLGTASSHRAAASATSRASTPSGDDRLDVVTRAAACIPRASAPGRQADAPHTGPPRSGHRRRAPEQTPPGYRHSCFAQRLSRKWVRKA